ncbi:hypothetical protein OS42_46230 [Dickeya oryzae]
MIDDPYSMLVKYEDMEKGYLTEQVSEYIDSFEYGLSERVKRSLVLSNRKNSPTLSQRRSDWHDYWSDDVQVFFEKFGFMCLNSHVGYV